MSSMRKELLSKHLPPLPPGSFLPPKRYSIELIYHRVKVLRLVFAMKGHKQEFWWSLIGVNMMSLVVCV